MIQVTKMTILTMLFIFGQSTTQGQSASESTTLQKPGLVNERARVEFLVGSFTTATYIPPMRSMQKGVTGKGTSITTWALDSMFLMIEDESFNSLFGRYKAHGILGFDSQTHQFVLSIFNNFGDQPTYHGNCVGDTLVLQTKVTSPRGSFDQKLVWYKDGESVRLRVLNDYGKGFLLTLEQTATPVLQKTK
jgi:hypothetical protein